MTRRILTGLRIDKIAAVDRPCQEHASADIMKRAWSQDERDEAAKSGIAMPGGGYPIKTTADLHDAVQAFGRAKDPVATKAHITSRAKSLGATDQLPEDWSKETKMLKELLKALGLPETGSEADVTKAVIKLASDEQKELVTKLATAEASLVKANEALELEKAKAPKMSPDNADDDCGPGGVAKGVAFETISGAFISKKMAGAMYDVLKSNDAQLRKNAEDIAKRDEADAVVTFAKRATDIGFSAEFGATMRKAYGGDSVAQAEVEKRIVALQKQVDEGALFKNFGGGGAEGSAEAELMAKVAELKKANPKLTDAQAYSKAYTARENAPIVKRMKEEAEA